MSVYVCVLEEEGGTLLTTPPKNHQRHPNSWHPPHPQSLLQSGAWITRTHRLRHRLLQSVTIAPTQKPCSKQLTQKCVRLWPRSKGPEDIFAVCLKQHLSRHLSSVLKLLRHTETCCFEQQSRPNLSPVSATSDECTRICSDSSDFKHSKDSNMKSKSWRAHRP